MRKRSVALGGLLVLAVWLQGCAIVSFPISLGKTAEISEFTMESAEKTFTLDKILVLDVSGVISAESGGGLLDLSDGNTVATISDFLDVARDDHRIKAVILRIDSPGGEVTASDIVYNEIKRFKEDRAEEGHPVKVIAAILGTGASGGYYIAQAADAIYIHPTGLTGSIGVMATFPNLSGLTKMVGVDMRIIKSGKHKDAASLWRDFSPGDREILEGLIDDMYERFLDVVSEGRPQLGREKIRELADGRAYTAQQAVEAKLVDGIAYLDEAIEKTKEAAGLADANVVTYRRSREFKGSIYARTPRLPRARIPDVNVIEINGLDLLGSIRRPGFYYLWLP